MNIFRAFASIYKAMGALSEDLYNLLNTIGKGAMLSLFFKNELM
jgi:hypothetical protein